MCSFEQIECKVVGVVDGGGAIGLAEETGNLREEVERTIGVVDFETGNFTCQAHNQFFAALEGQTHLLDRSLVGSESKGRRFL